MARPAGSRDELIDRIGPLVEVARRWLAPAAPIRDEALSRLPHATPFPRAMWQAAVETIFQPITEQNLRRFIDCEMAGSAAFRFPELIGQVLAGNVPAAAAQTIFCGVLAGSAQIVKTASADQLFPVLLARSIAQVDSRLGQCLEVVHWPGESSAENLALAEAADLVVVFGQDETIEAWRELADRRCRLLAHGPRTALELIELPERETDWPGLAERIAFDIAMYDQQGCLSPQQIYLACGAEAAGRFAAVLGTALSEMASRWPRQPGSGPDRLAGDLAIRRAREAHRIRRMVEPDGGPWLADELSGPPDNFDWTLLSTSGPAMQIGPGGRTVFLTRVDSLDHAMAAVGSAAESIQGVAIESPIFARFAERLGELGIPYVCRPGQLQRPPFGWPNDNIRPLRSLLV